MTALTTDPETEEPRKKSVLLPMLAGVGLAIILGGAGFLAARSGLIPDLAVLVHPAAAEKDGHDAGAGDTAAEVAFLPLEPIVVSLGPAAGSRYLRFRGELEVDPAHQAEVRRVMPRILDTLNGYLRAVSVAELEDPGALLLLRAQMLRRIQIVVGEAAVSDLLIVEFVLS